MYETSENIVGKSKGAGSKRRVSSQPLLPQQVQKGESTNGGYNMYPYHTLGAGKIFSGYASLAQFFMQPTMLPSAWLTIHSEALS